MNYRYESPNNYQKTNPYNYKENIKERHYLGKYNPNKEDIDYKNSKLPEIENFTFSDNNVNKNSCINNNNNVSNNFKLVINSIII